MRRAIQRLPCAICKLPKENKLNLTCSKQCEAQVDVKAKRNLNAIVDEMDREFSDVAYVKSILELEQKHVVQGKPQNWEEYWGMGRKGISIVSMLNTYGMSLVHYGVADQVKIIGARAEAMMPLRGWKCASDGFSEKRKMNLHFIGDQLLPGRGLGSLPNLDVSYHRKLYHDWEDTVDGMFALFNPGIGHPKLKKLWAPSVEKMLHRKQPMLVTAFSRSDLNRDLVELRKFDTRWTYVVEPEINPFGSLKYDLDVYNILEPVQSNRYAMVIQGW